jgi:crotonobetainyl-CoA:carnitine CoA-transferase CaiB-like acyl-CoA transferase
MLSVERTVAALALDGIKVVEFAAFAAGPMVGKHLGEHGARVVHVESRARPDGFRMHYPPYKDNRPGLDRTGSFAIFNDSKYSVSLNLKNARAIEIAKQLIGWADVLIENFVPGVMERLGLSYEASHQVNPSLIYLSSCNMGQTAKASQRVLARNSPHRAALPSRRISWRRADAPLRTLH